MELVRTCVLVPAEIRRGWQTLCSSCGQLPKVGSGIRTQVFFYKSSKHSYPLSHLCRPLTLIDFFLFKRIFLLLFLCVRVFCLHVCMHSRCVPGAHGGQNEASTSGDMDAYELSHAFIWMNSCPLQKWQVLLATELSPDISKGILNGVNFFKRDTT